MAKERENTNGIVNESVINCDQLPEVTNIQPMIRIIRGKQVMLDTYTYIFGCKGTIFILKNIWLLTIIFYLPYLLYF